MVLNIAIKIKILTKSIYVTIAKATAILVDGFVVIHHVKHSDKNRLTFDLSKD